MRGGAREGSGRKRSGRHTVNFWITDDEEAALKQYLEEIRLSEAVHPISKEAILESNGQTTVYDYLPKEKPTKVTKAMTKSIEAEAFVSWKVNLSSTVRKSLKSSKKKAAAFLAEELCIALNDCANNPTDKIAKQKVDYAADYIKMVVDARCKTDEWTDLVSGFMEYCNYTLAYDNDHVIKLWRKHPAI